MNPQTRILDIETMALGIVEACKSLKHLHHPVTLCGARPNDSDCGYCLKMQDCRGVREYLCPHDIEPDFQKAAQAIHDTKILKEIDTKCKTASENTNVTEIKLAFDMVRLWIKELRECECKEVEDNAKDR